MDRANSFIGSATSSFVAESSVATVISDRDNLTNVIVVVDPVCNISVVFIFYIISILM